MIEPGATKTLDELIARSLLNNAFVAVSNVDGVTIAAYRIHDTHEAELWRAVPDSEGTSLMRFLYVIDLRNYPEYM